MFFILNIVLKQTKFADVMRIAIKIHQSGAAEIINNWSQKCSKFYSFHSPYKMQ